MDIEYITVFGNRVSVEVTSPKENGSHLVTVKASSTFIPRRLRCYITPTSEFIELYIEGDKKENNKTTWVKTESDYKYKMSEYRLSSKLAKWMCLIYLKIRYDKWVKDFVKPVSEKFGYSIQRPRNSNTIYAINNHTNHLVKFESYTEEDGMRYIAKDNKDLQVQHYVLYNWEYAKVCVGLQ